MQNQKAIPARQRRSKDTEHRLLDAAERLMLRSEWDDISISEIALAAGASVGGFYARFPSKDAMLATLHDRYEADRNAKFKQLFGRDWTDVKLDERIRAFVGCTISLMHARRAVLRTFLIRYWRKPEDFDGKFDERLAGLYKQAQELLLECEESIGHRHPRKAVATALSMITAYCRDALVLKPAPGPGAVDQSAEELQEELSAMISAYLRGC